MIDSILDIEFGTVVHETVYKDRVPVTTRQIMKPIIPTPDRKSLLDQIFIQLQRLQTEDVIEFKIFADQKTREPCRIELCSRARLV